MKKSLDKMSAREKNTQIKTNPALGVRENELFRMKHPQDLEFNNPFPGIRLFHQLRLQNTLSLLDKAFDFISPAGTGKIGRIVEIGCGDGFVLERILQTYPAAKLWAVDMSATSLLRARRRAPKAVLLQADAGLLPLPTSSFDITLCPEILEHVPDDAGLLKEVFRILRPGGFLILTTPNLYTLRNILRQSIGREVKVEISQHVREYYLEQVKRLLRSTGFHIINFRSVGFYIPKMHWFFKSRLASRVIFSLARCWPARGRDLMFLAKKPVEPAGCAPPPE